MNVPEVLPAGGVIGGDVTAFCILTKITDGLTAFVFSVIFRTLILKLKTVFASRTEL